MGILVGFLVNFISPPSCSDLGLASSCAPTWLITDPWLLKLPGYLFPRDNGTSFVY